MAAVAGDAADGAVSGLAPADSGGRLGKSGRAIALPAALMLLRRDEDKLLPRISMGLHLSLLWMILLALAAELYWFAAPCHGAWRLGKRHCDGCRRWGDYGALRGRTASRMAFRVWPALYACLAAIPVVVALVVLLVVTNFRDGVVYRQTAAAGEPA